MILLCFKKTRYDEYQRLMLKLLQYLYRAFDFEDLWLAEEDYRSQSIVRAKLDVVDPPHSKQSKSSKKRRKKNSKTTTSENVNGFKEWEEPESDTNSQRSFLMTRWGFARLLQLKCTQFLSESKGILVRVALKLLMEYPLNDQVA